MRVLLLLVSALLVSAPSPDDTTALPLETARTLARTKYEGYTWGGSGEKKIDCTQFVLAVVTDLAEQCETKLSKADRRTLAVVLSKEDGKQLQALVEKSDKKIRGVQQALIDVGLGVAVEPKKAKPGDFVQYWYRTSAGKWAGHAGLIEKIEKKKATIYGSHKTTLQSERELERTRRKGGIGSGPVFDLTDKKRKVFVARWTRTKAK